MLDGSEHGATLLRGRPGILHGAETYLLQDEDGQISDTWSVSAGLDYPAVGPEHAFLKESKRAEYVAATDFEALEAFALLARSEGIVCAFESAHALAHALKLIEQAEKDMVLAHKKAIDEHLAAVGIPVSYTNVFWGGRSEIKPSEISPFAYREWCQSRGIDPDSIRATA